MWIYNPGQDITQFMIIYVYHINQNNILNIQDVLYFNDIVKH